MGTIMSLVIIAPMVAPVIGALLLKFASWQMMFVALAVFGAIAAIIAMSYQETIETRYTGSVARSWTRLGVVLKNPNFVALLCVFSITPIALMAFLAAGSYIYVDGFGLTEQQFSYAFAFNAMFASFGPRIYMKISRKVPIPKIVTGCYALLALCGVATLTIGHLSPFVFAFIAAPATLVIISTRIPGTNLMLEQQSTDTGSAVALIQFFSMMCGSLGMILVSLRPETLIQNLGFIQLAIGLIGGGMWLVLRKKDFVVHNLPKMDVPAEQS
jgi:DHA1 family bicyclomycin/chloramphenicol resistance-like MFS transporter